jgi:hypothetical protein
MKYPVILLITSLFTFSSLAQKAPVKYGKISDEEIHLNAYQSSGAVILCDYGTYHYDARLGQLYLYFTRHLRIKILTSDGLKYATQKIPFYDLKSATYFRNNRVFELRAQTLNINAKNEVKRDKVKPKNYTVTGPDTNFNSMLTIKFPNVAVGSIIEYEIKIPTIEVVNLPEWIFEQDIPVIHSELRVISPEYIQYTGKAYRVDYLDVSETKYQTSVLSYPRGSISYQSYQMQFVKSNIPAASPGTPYYERMRLKIMLDFASQKITIPGIPYLFRATEREYKYKDRAEKDMTLTNNSYILYKKPDLETLPKKMLKDPYFGPPLNIHMGINDTINSLIKGNTNDEEKIQIIYHFISNHMSWNGVYRSYVDPALSKFMLKIISQVSNDKAKLNKSLSKPYDKQIGTNAEINFILINALRKAGIRANPVLVSTLDNSFLDPELFSLQQFNHVVALVEINNKSIILDAVHTNDGPVPSTQKLNSIGLVVKTDEAYWITLQEESEK